VRDLDPINARKLVSNEISDIYFQSQLLKPSGLVRVAFGFDKDIYFIRVYLEVVEDRFPGACHLLNRYNILLKYLVRGPPI